IVRVVAGATVFASEVKVFNSEVLVADIHGHALGQLEANAEETLVGNTGRFVREAVQSVGNVTDGVNAVRCFRFDTGTTDAEADVRLDRAAFVEVVQTIDHQVGDVGITSRGSSADAHAIDAVRDIQFTAALTESAFKTQAVGEAVAETKADA